MTFQANPEAIPYLVAAIVSALLAVFAWRRRGQAMAPAFAVMMTGEAAWALFEALELVVVEIAAKQPFFELRNAGAVTAILGLLAVVLRYTGHVEWLKLPVFTAICTPAVVLILFAWTNNWHHFYWYGHIPVSVRGFAFARPIYGPGFWVHFTYCYGLVAASTILLAQAVVTSAGLYRVQAAVMLFGVLLPWFVNMLDMSQVLGVMYTDTAAMTFAVTGLAFLPAVLRYRLLELKPVAWASVVREMNDPVLVIDASGQLVELNQAAQRLSGRPLNELLGIDVARSFSRWPELLQRLKVMPEQGESSFELAGPEPQATAAAFDARISRLGGHAELLGWVVVLRDITEHKRAEEERVRMLSERAARAEAEAANRAKDRFLATLSHELRTPLTPVLAAVTGMLGDAATPESLRVVLEMIRRNITLESRLIDDLLDLARIRKGALDLKRENIDAHDLIKHVIAICDDDFRRAEIKLGLDLAASEHHVSADPIRFQQALWNLIKNAIKFTPAGGRVSVRTVNRQNGPGSCDGAALLLEVSDTGIGIEANMIDRIFDIAEQGGTAASRRFGGLGLGLLLSRSIIEGHGGKIMAASRGAGLGATFTIQIPTVSTPAPVPERESGPVESSATATRTTPRRLKILLVDDNADTLVFLSTMLARRGHDVATASEMAEALRLATEGDCDLLISDIELPDGSGLELMESIRSRKPIPGIALSGFGSAGDIEQSLAAGFAVHLTKPVDFRRLERVIEQIAAGAAAESAVSG